MILRPVGLVFEAPRAGQEGSPERPGQQGSGRFGLAANPAGPPAAPVADAPASSPPQAPLTAQDQVFGKDGEHCWFVKLADIKLFEINGSYTRIHFENHRPLIPRPLQQLEARLDPKVFFRANRPQIINLKWIASVEPWFSNTLRLTLKDGPEVEVSRQQSVRFRGLLSL